MNRRHFLLSSAAAAGSLYLPSAFAAAADYPNRPVRLVVPFPAGGGTDALARQVAKAVGQEWNQSIVVENRPGAGGSIGAAHIAGSAPDGYSLLMTTAGVSAINPELYEKLPYDPATQFAPISRASSTVFVVVVHPSLPVKSIADLIELAKRQPGRLTFGSAGNGAAGHLPGELFKSMAGIDIRHIPYRGTAPAMTDLIGGQISMMFAILGAALPAVKAGQLRALATTGPQRSVVLPDLPTVAEAGLPGYSADEWWGLAAPAGTPESVLKKWSDSIKRFVQAPDSRAQLIEQGFEPAFDTPEAFAKLIESDRKKWGDVIRAAHVTLG
jgi:tripartite-type tricarboxylate transporter receptor subunit TctC